MSSKVSNVSKENEEHNENNKENLDENDVKIYEPASGLILDLSIKEYVSEQERSRSLDSKTGIIISSLIAIITLYLPLIPLDEIKKIVLEEPTRIIVLTVILVFLFISFLGLLAAFIFFIKTISTKHYSRINFDLLIDETIITASKRPVEIGLLEHFHTILSNNSEINTKKANLYQVGITITVISFAILYVTTIILKIIL